MSANRLHPTDLELLADLVAERLADLIADAAAPAPPTLVDARTLARTLGVSRDLVYDRAAELGGVKLGSGVRAPWRFDVDEARARLANRSPSRAPAAELSARGGRAGSRRRRPPAAPGRSLAIRGGEA